MKKKLLPLLLVLIFSLGGWLWIKIHANDDSSLLLASGTLESSQIKLASRVGGRVTAVLKQEGEQVKVKEAILQFDFREQKAQLEELQAREQAAQARLNLLNAGSRAEDIRAAQASYQAAQWRLKQVNNGSRQAEKDQAAALLKERESQFKLAETEWQRVESLFQSEAASKQQLDLSLQQLQSAQTALTLAQKSQALLLEGARQEERVIAAQQASQQKALLDKVRRGVRPQEIQEVHANLLQVQALIKQLQIRLEEEFLYAPCACQLSLMTIEPGELVTPGATVVSLLNPQELWVKVYLSPLELKFVALGQNVQLKVDAYPEETFQGKVVFIASKAEYTPRNIQTRDERIHQVFAIKVAVDNQNKKLFPGMPIDVVWPKLVSEDSEAS